MYTHLHKFQHLKGGGWVGGGGGNNPNMVMCQQVAGCVVRGWRARHLSTALSLTYGGLTPASTSLSLSRHSQPSRICFRPFPR